MTSASPDTRRNAALRTALRERWPLVKWAVRNGQGAWASVTWVDGPIKHDVAAFLRGLLAPDGYPWGADLTRVVSDELLAVAHWRSRQHGGCPQCHGVDPHAPRVPRAPDARLDHRSAECVSAAQHVDAATLAPEDLAAARAVLAVAGALDGGYRHRSDQLDRTVTALGDAIDGILA